MIPQRNISLIANSLATDNRQRPPETVIERDYVLAWFLTGLAEHPLRENLAFKGGTALRRCWVDNYRFSEDLDFTIVNPITLETILSGFDDIFAAIETKSGLHIKFDREDRHNHQNSHTFYLSYQGPLPAPNDVKVDITITEVLCFPLQARPILRTYDLFSDLPADPTINVYAIEEIVVEKLVALSDRARHEPRDLYDLWYLFHHHDLRIAEMQAELEIKLEFRQRTIENIVHAVAAKEDRLRRLWSTRLSHQMSDLPPFETVFRELMRTLRAADLPSSES